MSIGAIAGQAATDQRPPVQSLPASQSLQGPRRRSMLPEGGALEGDKLSAAARSVRRGIPVGDAEFLLGTPNKLPRHFWKVSAGYHVNKYSKSDIRIVQPDYGNDFTLRGVKAKQRTSFSYIYNWPNGYPQFDEPQSSIKINYGDRKTGWGVQVGLDHHKYLVRDWDKQMVHVDGTLLGEHIDMDDRLYDYGWMFQHTNGLNRVSALAVKSFKLPAPRGDELNWNVKCGPDAYVLYTSTALYDHVGGTDKMSGPYHLGGYGATLENSIEYSRRGKWSFELFHTADFVNLPNVKIPHGHAEQSFWINQAGFTLGRKINVPNKPAKPAGD